MLMSNLVHRELFTGNRDKIEPTSRKYTKKNDETRLQVLSGGGGVGKLGKHIPDRGPWPTGVVYFPKS